MRFPPEKEGGGSWGNHGFPHERSRALHLQGKVVLESHGSTRLTLTDAIHSGF